MGMNYKRMMGVTDGFDMKMNKEMINKRGGNGEGGGVNEKNIQMFKYFETG